MVCLSFSFLPTESCHYDATALYTSVPKTYLALGISAVTTILIFFNIAGALITNLVGFLYPAYASFKALESATKDDDVQWLTYWIVFAFFNIIEFFTDVLLYWLPMYFVAKTAILMWLFIPQTKGAVKVYQQVLRPFLLENQKKVDHTVTKIKKAASDLATHVDSKSD
ncbi:TB2/DP1, HVA22 family-domain-containing protein [Paraphysoderma sedebokerense]|nr:TB2/DP1, HVA22 family-domain-containing protein [Paraphysoderma sedebokerense]